MAETSKEKRDEEETRERKQKMKTFWKGELQIVANHSCVYQVPIECKSKFVVGTNEHLPDVFVMKHRMPFEVFQNYILPTEMNRFRLQTTKNLEDGSAFQPVLMRLEPSVGSTAKIIITSLSKHLETNRCIAVATPRNLSLLETPLFLFAIPRRFAEWIFEYTISPDQTLFGIFYTRASAHPSQTHPKKMKKVQKRILRKGSIECMEPANADPFIDTFRERECPIHIGDELCAPSYNVKGGNEKTGSVTESDMEKISPVNMESTDRNPFSVWGPLTDKKDVQNDLSDNKMNIQGSTLSKGHKIFMEITPVVRQEDPMENDCMYGIVSTSYDDDVQSEKVPPKQTNVESTSVTSDSATSDVYIASEHDADPKTVDLSIASGYYSVKDGDVPNTNGDTKGDKSDKSPDPFSEISGYDIKMESPLVIDLSYKEENASLHEPEGDSPKTEVPEATSSFRGLAHPEMIETARVCMLDHSYAQSDPDESCGESQERSNRTALRTMIDCCSDVSTSMENGNCMPTTPSQVGDKNRDPPEGEKLLLAKKAEEENRFKLFVETNYFTPSKGFYLPLSKKSLVPDRQQVGNEVEMKKGYDFKIMEESSKNTEVHETGHESLPVSHQKQEEEGKEPSRGKNQFGMLKDSKLISPQSAKKKQSSNLSVGMPVEKESAQEPLKKRVKITDERIYKDDRMTEVLEPLIVFPSDIDVKAFVEISSHGKEEPCKTEMEVKSSWLSPVTSPKIITIEDSLLKSHNTHHVSKIEEVTFTESSKTPLRAEPMKPVAQKGLNTNTKNLKFIIRKPSTTQATHAGEETLHLMIDPKKCEKPISSLHSVPPLCTTPSSSVKVEKIYKDNMPKVPPPLIVFPSYIEIKPFVETSSNVKEVEPCKSEMEVKPSCIPPEIIIIEDSPPKSRHTLHTFNIEEVKSPESSKSPHRAESMKPVAQKGLNTNTENLRHILRKPSTTQATHAGVQTLHLRYDPKEREKLTSSLLSAPPPCTTPSSSVRVPSSLCVAPSSSTTNVRRTTIGSIGSVHQSFSFFTSDISKAKAEAPNDERVERWRFQDIVQGGAAKPPTTAPFTSAVNPASAVDLSRQASKTSPTVRVMPPANPIRPQITQIPYGHPYPWLYSPYRMFWPSYPNYNDPVVLNLMARAYMVPPWYRFTKNN